MVVNGRVGLQGPRDKKSNLNYEVREGLTADEWSVLKSECSWKRPCIWDQITLGWENSTLQQELAQNVLEMKNKDLCLKDRDWSGEYKKMCQWIGQQPTT